ncbi:MAG: ribonuclease J [Caldilineaceae bacterium]
MSLALLSDSTGAERPGFTPSESIVEDAFDHIFRDAPGRIIVTTFASLLSRVQQVVNVAQKYGRKVAFTGYSMRNNTEIARDLGYLRIPEDMIFDLRRNHQLDDNQQVIVSTGSQGQPEAALSRMAEGRHRDIEIKPGDTVILSSHPIPGNEEEVGARDQQPDSTRSRGHLPAAGSRACQWARQPRRATPLAEPGQARYLYPSTGNKRMLHSHRKTAVQMSFPADNIFVLNNGDAIKFEKGDTAIVERNYVPADAVLVDGSGVDDIGPAVLQQEFWQIMACGGDCPWDKSTGSLMGLSN